MLRKFKQSTGFTTIELVMVIVILGILSVTIAPTFFDNAVFQTRGFSDQLLATLRYAQKSAIAQHRLVCVDLTATTVTLSISGNTTCNLALNLPDRADNTLTAPSGITINPATAFNFDALGRASSAVTISISGISHAIIVEAETGYVHQ
ncbi:MAG: type II secretion system protein [Methylococcales bacterium]|nr:type II secretion system protein [Methylococcales bacterium]MDP3837592.1 type II secretion system protein [Methylococcales bacterium]